MPSSYLLQPLRTEAQARAELHWDDHGNLWLECAPTFDQEFAGVELLDLRRKDYGRSWAWFGLSVFASIVCGVIWWSV